MSKRWRILQDSENDGEFMKFKKCRSLVLSSMSRSYDMCFDCRLRQECPESMVYSEYKGRVLRPQSDLRSDEGSSSTEKKKKITKETSKKGKDTTRGKTSGGLRMGSSGAISV